MTRARNQTVITAGRSGGTAAPAKTVRHWRAFDPV
jgi:hypothetical protein